MTNVNTSGQNPEKISQGASTLSPAKKSGPSSFSVLGAGGSGLAEAFDDSINFAQILQSLLVTSMTNILNQITKRGEAIANAAKKDLDAVLAEISKYSGNPKDAGKLQYYQSLYTTEHDFWNNEQTQNGSQRDQLTQGISSENQQVSNFFQGLASLNNVYSTLSHLIA